MSQGTLIGIDQLLLGSTSSCDLLDLNGQIAIPTGTPITPGLLSRIKTAGIVALIPRRPDYATHHVVANSTTASPRLTNRSKASSDNSTSRGRSMPAPLPLPDPPPTPLAATSVPSRGLRATEA